MSEENIEDVTFENNDEHQIKEEEVNEKPISEKKKRKIKAEKKLDEVTEKYNDANDKYLRITQLGFKENHGISYMGKKLVKSRCEVNFMYMWAGMLLDEDYI